MKDETSFTVHISRNGDRYNLEIEGACYRNVRRSEVEWRVAAAAERATDALDEDDADEPDLELGRTA